MAESKLDSTFQMNQFRIRAYKNFRHDRNWFGGGLVYKWEHSIYTSKQPPYVFLIWNYWQLRFTKTNVGGFF